MPETMHPAGALYLISTPIGNLEDMTFRAVNTLRECDVIFAEDTRRTKVLLARYEIAKRLESYHSFNEHGRTPELLARVRSGEKIGLVTDAGTPCVADPGFLLNRAANHPRSFLSDVCGRSKCDSFRQIRLLRFSSRQKRPPFRKDR